MSSFFVEGKSPSLIASLGVSFHGFGLLKVRFVSDSSKELMNWFFEYHFDYLPHLVLVVYQVLPPFFEWSLTSNKRTYGFLGLFDIVLQPGKHLDPGHEVPEVSWRVKCQVFLEPLSGSQLELIACHRHLLGALPYLTVGLPIALVVVVDGFVFAFP